MEFQPGNPEPLSHSWKPHLLYLITYFIKHIIWHLYRDKMIGKRDKYWALYVYRGYCHIKKKLDLLKWLMSNWLNLPVVTLWYLQK